MDGISVKKFVSLGKAYNLVDRGILSEYSGHIPQPYGRPDYTEALKIAKASPDKIIARTYDGYNTFTLLKGKIKPGIGKRIAESLQKAVSFLKKAKVK